MPAGAVRCPAGIGVLGSGAKLKMLGCHFMAQMPYLRGA